MHFDLDNDESLPELIDMRKKSTPANRRKNSQQDQFFPQRDEDRIPIPDLESPRKTQRKISMDNTPTLSRKQEVQKADPRKQKQYDNSKNLINEMIKKISQKGVSE